LKKVHDGRSTRHPRFAFGKSPSRLRTSPGSRTPPLRHVYQPQRWLALLHLGQLERAGYVEKTRVEQKGRYPARRIYQITPQGTAHFRTELRKLLFDVEGRERVFDPFNTALAFGHFVDEEELREAVTAHLTWAQERAAWIRTQQEFWRLQEISFAHAKIIEHGLAHYEAEIGWLQRFLRDLDVRETTVLKQAPRANVS
jgi:DNA-binding PadR family transcriptional regulator